MTMETEPLIDAGLSGPGLLPEPTTYRRFVRFRDSQPLSVLEEVISEIRFSIFLGDRELVTLMCSPWKLRELVVGFLYVEGFISGVDDIELLRVCLEDRMAEVVLRNREVVFPERKILTSGCTGGQTFGAYLAALDRLRVPDESTVPPGLIYRQLRRLYESAELYRRAGGVHTSVLVRGEEIVAVAEDIGRHNTLDKLLGTCLLSGEPTAGCIVLTTGRISSEMLLKSAIMGVPIVGSRTSPTELAITLAERLNITVIGYIRPGGSSSMNVYTHPWRLAVESDSR